MANLAQLLKGYGPEDEDVITLEARSQFTPDEPDEDEPPDVPLMPLPARVAEPAVTAIASATPRRRPLPPRDDLADAQTADEKAQRMAKFEAALDAAAYRRPIQTPNVGSPHSDALMKRIGVQRQAQAEARSEEERANDREMLGRVLGEDVSGLSDATIAKLLGRQDATQKATTAKLVAEAKARAQFEKEARERRYKLTDTKDDRTWKEGESEKDRKSRERAAFLSAGTKKDETLEKEVADLGKDLEGTAALKKAFDAIDTAFAANPKDKPGVGRWDSIKFEAFDSPADSTVKQGLRQIVATILKKQSGQGVTESEYKRTLNTYGITSGGSEQAFDTGYAAMKRAAVAAAREAEAKRRPGVVDRYRERGGTSAADLEGAPAATVTVRKGNETLEIPAEDLKEAEADGYARIGG